MACLLGGVWVICCGWVVGLLEVGMAMGQGGSEGWGLRPAHKILSFSILAPHDGKYFLTPSLPPSGPTKPRITS